MENKVHCSKQALRTHSSFLVGKTSTSFLMGIRIFKVGEKIGGKGKGVTFWVPERDPGRLHWLTPLSDLKGLRTVVRSL